MRSANPHQLRRSNLSKMAAAMAAGALLGTAGLASAGAASAPAVPVRHGGAALRAALRRYDEGA